MDRRLSILIISVLAVSAIGGFYYYYSTPSGACAPFPESIEGVPCVEIRPLVGGDICIRSTDTYLVNYNNNETRITFAQLHFDSETEAQTCIDNLLNVVDRSDEPSMERSSYEIYITEVHLDNELPFKAVYRIDGSSVSLLSYAAMDIGSMSDEEAESIINLMVRRGRSYEA